MRNVQQQFEQKRDYIQLIQRVGGYDKYQFYLFLIFTGISLLQTSLIFAIPYLFHVQDYKCNQVEGQLCTNYVCSLSINQRSQYIKDSPFYSLADQLKIDFRCQNTSMLTFFSSLVFISSISSMVTFSSFTEYLGRKKSLLLSSSFIIIGLILIILSGYFESILLVIFGIVFTYSGTENSYQYTYCFSNEVVTEQKRVFYINILNFIYCFGIIIDPIIFYYIQDWFRIYICIFLPLSIITFLGVIFIIQKTPIDLLKSQETQQILKALNRIAVINNKQFTITIQQIDNLKKKYELTISKNGQQTQFNSYTLFKYNSLRKLAIPLMLLNFISLYIFYAPSVITNSLSGNLFKGSLIEGLSYAVSSYLIYFFLQYLTRKNSCYILNSLLLIFIALLLSQCKNEQSLLYSIYYFIFRLFSSIYFATVFLINYQTLPTQIRAAGSGIIYAFGTLSGVIQPVIISLFKSYNINVLYQFGIIIVIGYIPIIFIKETSNISPPQIIEQLIQQAEQNNKHNQLICKNNE